MVQLITLNALGTVALVQPLPEVEREAGMLQSALVPQRQPDDCVTPPPGAMVLSCYGVPGKRREGGIGEIREVIVKGNNGWSSLRW